MSEQAWIAFANAFWVFIGIVSGAIIQFIFFQLNQRRAQKNAVYVLSAELELNSEAVDELAAEIDRLKQRYLAGEREPSKFWINMDAFDYSAVGPLVNAGYFHKLLGKSGVKDYLFVMRELNKNSAQIISQIVQKNLDGADGFVFLEHLSNAKVREWQQAIDRIKNRLR